MSHAPATVYVVDHDRAAREATAPALESAGRMPIGAFLDAHAGFKPLDIPRSVRVLLRRTAEGSREVGNRYGRVVRDGGNAAAATP